MKASITIRPAVRTDEPAILRLAEEAIAADEGCAFRSASRVTVETWIRNFVDHSAVFLAERDHELVGGIGALVYPRPLDDRPTVVVLSLWVTPSARDTRAAARLLRAVEGWAARQGANSVSVPSWQERSDVFYQSLGYVPQERVWNKKVKAG